MQEVIKSPILVITGINEDNSEHFVRVADFLLEKNTPFFLLSEDFDVEIPNAESIVLESAEQIPSADIVLDLNWSTSASDSALSVLERFENAILLTTSLVSTATDGSLISGRQNVVGFNGLPGFFPLATVLEVTRSAYAEDAAVQKVIRFLEQLGFSTEIVQDRVGYVAPRVLSMIVNEGAFCVMEGVADAKAIDTAMKLGTNYPKGPLEWADEIGIKVVLDLLDALYDEYKQPRYRACMYLREMVRSSRLGRRTMFGFYRYSEDGVLLEV